MADQTVQNLTDLQRQNQQLRRRLQQAQNRNQEQQRQRNALWNSLNNSFQLARAGSFSKSLEQLLQIPLNQWTSPIKKWLNDRWTWIKQNPKKSILIVITIIVLILCGIGIKCIGMCGFISLVKQFAIVSWKLITKAASTLYGWLVNAFNCGRKIFL